MSNQKIYRLPNALKRPSLPKDAHIALFVTCMIDMMRPNVAQSAIKLIEATGYHANIVKSQTCCGQPAYNMGSKKIARKLAKKFIKEHQDYDAIILPSGSCAGMIRCHYPELFDDNEIEHKRQAQKLNIWELSEFLQIHGLGDLLKNQKNIQKSNQNKSQKNNGQKNNGNSSQKSQQIAYHDSCSSLRDLGVKEQPRSLLSQAGYEIIESEDSENCCGFGGSFSVKYPDISTHIGAKRCKNLLATGQSIIACGDVGCILQLESIANGQVINRLINKKADIIDAKQSNAKQNRSKQDHDQEKVKFYHYAELLAEALPAA